MTHAYLAPSGADQWGPGRCPGAPRMQRAFPERDGEEAKEGTVAHDFSAQAIQGQRLPVGTPHSNGKQVTPDMPEACEAYIADCTAEFEQAGAVGAIVGIERWIAAHAFIDPDCDGTPDFFVVDFQAKRIVLKDFKYGHGYVDAWRNYQLAVYLIAIFETVIGAYPDDSWTIEAAIYQPRNYHHTGPVRYWRPKGSELESMRVLFVQAAAEAKMEGALCRTGKWCRYCTAAHACNTLAEAVSFMRSHASRAQIYQQDVTDLGREMTANVHALGLLKARQEALEEQAMALLTTGARIPGWGGEHRSGRMAWNVEPERAAMWCAALGVDISKPGVITPTQAKKLGLTDDLIGGITHTPSSFALVQRTGDDFTKGFTNGI